MLAVIDDFGARHFFRPVCALALCCILIAGGCKSVSEKVEEQLEKQDFSAARLLLEEAGVGQVLLPDADEEDLAARAAFEENVRVHYRSKAEGLLEEGKVRAALASIWQGLNFCPWSDGLESDYEGYVATVRDLDGLKQQWSSSVIDSSVAITVARSLVADLDPVMEFLGDTPELETALQVSIERIGRWWAEEIHKARGRLSPQQLRELTSEFKSLPVDGDSTDALRAFLREFTALPRYEEQKAAAARSLRRRGLKIRIELSSIPGALSSIESFTGRLRHEVKYRQWGALAPCIESLVGHFDLWQSSDLFAFFDSPQVSFSTLRMGEKLLGAGWGRGMRPAVSRAHLHRARLRAGEGHQAVLALMHIERIKQIERLEPGLAGEGLDAVERIAQASLSTSLPQKTKISLNVDPEIDPFFYEILLSSVYAEIASRCQLNGSLEWGQGGLDIAVTKADSFWPSKDRDLRTVTSKYFSHMESVPNPQKEYLRRQLESARVSADSSKASYKSAGRYLESAADSLESAANSYRLYGEGYDYLWTNYTTARSAYQRALSGYNSARTRVNYAIDAYNSCLNKYKNEPEYVKRRVYLPYSFREGTVKFGWDLEMRGRVNKRSFQFQEESTESDFVRTGTKYNDENERYRRDEPMGIDLSTDRFYGHLTRVVKKFCDRVNPFLASLEYDKISELHPNEEVVVGWLLHPWGVQPEIARHLDLPDWISSLADAIRLEYRERPPPEILLYDSEPPLARDLNTESIARLYEPLVCQIVVSDNNVELGWGSGTLVSKDGLILTCAHVLVGPKIKVRFHKGELKGDYVGDVVFVNEKKDVALLRAVNVKATACASIRLKAAAARGEEIVSVGYPVAPLADAPNVLGTSKGVVSNPKIADEDMFYLLADINISPGSSGGPLISMVDGSILGVVLQGINPKFRKATEGYCRAAPGSLLSGWLGISPSNGQQKGSVEGLAESVLEDPFPEPGEATADAGNEELMKLVRRKLQSVKSEDKEARDMDFFRGIDKAFLGIGHIDNEKGALVTTVHRGSPAAAAGLKEDDIIVAVNSKKVDSDSFAGAVEVHAPGSKITLHYLRGGAPGVVEVVLGDYAWATATLIEALKDQNYRVRAVATFSLGKIGIPAKKAIPQIRILLHDPSSVVQKYAKTALDRLDPESE